MINSVLDTIDRNKGRNCCKRETSSIQIILHRYKHDEQKWATAKFSNKFKMIKGLFTQDLRQKTENEDQYCQNQVP